MPTKPNYNIKVKVKPFYIENQSFPEQERYVFGYTITIKNEGNIAARLLTRHWIITDASDKKQEVHGEGVVGEQPLLQPGDSFEYTSGAILETPVGSMQGSYQMLADNGVAFDAEIPAFILAPPRTLH